MEGCSVEGLKGELGYYIGNLPGGRLSMIGNYLADMICYTLLNSCL